MSALHVEMAAPIAVGSIGLRASLFLFSMSAPIVAVLYTVPSYAALCRSLLLLLLKALRVEMAAALAAGSADLEGRERAVREAEQHLTEQQAELRALQARSADLQRHEADVAAGQSRLQEVAAAVSRERQVLARERAQLQVGRGRGLLA